MDESFETFFRERIKDRGISLKKLSELTGIAISHLENMVRGNFDDVPSAPYFHGYIIRLGAAWRVRPDALSWCSVQPWPARSSGPLSAVKISAARR